jgi:hypothetical protein
MGLWDWLRPPRGRGVVTGDGAFAMHVVGTSFHQQMLEDVCGKRTRAVGFLCTAHCRQNFKWHCKLLYGLTGTLKSK